jgi:hypothetical protein
MAAGLSPNQDLSNHTIVSQFKSHVHVPLSKTLLMLTDPPFPWMTIGADTIASLLFPLTAFQISLTNDNLFHAISVGIPCFLLAEYVALAKFQWWYVEEALGVMG